MNETLKLTDVEGDPALGEGAERAGGGLGVPPVRGQLPGGHVLHQRPLLHLPGHLQAEAEASGEQ